MLKARPSILNLPTNFFPQMSVFINRNGDSGCNQTVVACEVGQTQHCPGAEERESWLHKYGRREPRSQSYETREDSDLTSLPPPSCSLDEVGGGAGCASRPQRLRIQLGLCHQWPGLGLHWQALDAPSLLPTFPWTILLSPTCTWHSRLMSPRLACPSFPRTRL